MKGLGLGTGVAVVVFTLSPGTGMAGGERLSLGAARVAAREAVLAHATYRVIHHPSVLRTRSCWRAPRRTVRCSLEVTVGYRCELRGPPPAGRPCAAVTGGRRWLVRVRAAHRARKPSARVVSVSSW